MTPEANLIPSFDYRLVALSVLIATLAAYAALDLSGRVTAARGRLRAIWLAGGAIAMGTGIWSMHYVGMLAYHLPVSVAYDWPTVLVSLAAAVIAAAIALFVASRREMGPVAIGVGALLMGTAIASMHYIGMEAMRLPAMCHYSPGIVALSCVLAVVISLVGLWLTFHLRSDSRSFGWRKVASTILMGAAIPVMHYTGMAAVTFTPMPDAGDLTHSVAISSLGTVGIIGVTLIVLMLAIMTSLVDRRFSEQSVKLHVSEQRLRQLVESAQVVLWRSGMNPTEFTYVNQQAEDLLGYSSSRWITDPGFWLDHLHEQDRDLVKSYCQAAVEKNEPQRFEHRMIGADGNIVWLKTSIRLVSGTEKKELVGVMTDITDRKRAQEEAEHASRRTTDLLGQIKQLNSRLEQENSRMSSELDITHRLQHMMLPGDEELCGIPNLDISASMETATEVGGDYYDVVSREGSVVFGIGDVTGHGLESGVISIMLQTAIRTLLASGAFESQKYFEVLNRVVFDNARRMKCDRNLTLSLLRYQDRMLTISGQHEEVLIVREDGGLERIDTVDLGFPLGLEEQIAPFIRETEVPLRPGDVMVVYTDGVTEAINGVGVAYGIERLCQVVKATHRQLAAKIREAILTSVREHMGDQHLLDDMSLVVVKHA